MNPKQLSTEFLALLPATLTEDEQIKIEKLLVSLLENYTKQNTELDKYRTILANKNEEIFELKNQNKRLHKAYKLKSDAFDNISLNSKGKISYTHATTNSSVQSNRNEENIQEHIVKKENVKFKEKKKNKNKKKSKKNLFFDLFLLLAIFIFLCIEIYIFVI